MTGTTRIIGVGNPLMGDDGFGIAVVERLAAANLPDGVEVIDGGTGGVTLLSLMEGAAKVILVDALEFGSDPGTILRLTADELQSPEETEAFSLHHTGLAQVLALGRELGTLPPVVIYGVQQESVVHRIGLSAAMAAAVEPLIAGIRHELGCS